MGSPKEYVMLYIYICCHYEALQSLAHQSPPCIYSRKTGQAKKRKEANEILHLPHASVLIVIQYGRKWS